MALPLLRRSASRRGLFILRPQFWSGCAITGFFLFMMLQLYNRETKQNAGVNRLGISPDLLTVTWINYDQFMWVYRGGEKLGIYSLQVKRTEDNRAYVLTSRSRLALNMMNQKLPLSMDVRVNMNRMFELQEFRGRVDLAGQKLEMDGFTDGLLLYFRALGPALMVPDGEQTARFELPEPLMLADAIRPVVAQSDRLKVGEKWTAMASDPLSGKFQVPVEVVVRAIETVDINGEAMELFRVTEAAGEATTISWYDAYGRVMKSDLGNGMVMIRADDQEVFEIYPEFGVDLEYPAIDREAIRAEAARRPLNSAEGLLNWTPEI